MKKIIKKVKKVKKNKREQIKEMDCCPNCYSPNPCECGED